ncbi:folyl-polyglutamate synthetase [Deinococcus ruber]|uniref:tetrahydrofolate synthase n=1 Tax=Deinococcus ruber TaxID=1848197 RepID=A0A918CHA1_9DEIO|nr:folyl-polyglutamate synthetase [Deinococcus ruber]
MWLFQRQRFGVHPGLSRVRALLARLGNPQGRFEAVLVGGTNGKGSVAATLSAMLTASGRRTALFTSPHLTRFAERFLIDGAELPVESVLSALKRVRPHAEALEASFFEIVTALGCLLFAEAGTEMAVMEVGLGGRLDATNALEPLLSVLTNVGLDHTAILGDTLSAIAGEKAGILRAGRPAVTGIERALLPILEATGAAVWVMGRDATLQADSLGWDGWQIRLSVPGAALSFQTPLLGRHGAENAALAALAALRLGLPEAAIRAGAAQTRWPGRLELLPFGSARRVLLDGAHNPDGARALGEALRGLGIGRVPFVFGATREKDIEGVIRALEPLMSEVILTRSAHSPRAADPADLAHLFSVPVRLSDGPSQALSLLPEGLSVACGSLYLVGEVRALLLGEAGENWERWQ